MVAGLLWLDRRAVRLDLVAGTKEPGGQSWPGSAEIPPASRSKTVAAFNSGFLLRDSGGGFYQAGHHVGRLQRGAASIVVDKTGAISLGEWGRDVRMTPSTYAVRQNLHLIVDRSRPVKGLVHNGHKLWGSRRSQLQWTWRSGLGIDAAGNPIYVAGNHFTLVSLADALTQAGAVRGMQLDIHTPMVTANLFDLGRSDRRRAPVRLLPTMSRPADRYAAPDQRDFITATLR
ncbi:phosphodiester glycosidase family protein [Aquihabitans sp. G128]|uniref:phosphodiester glycosidase family protein n=1 Tax=Aquihabitans sp. G128 TaxID=2849779 RepID=UPI001C231002|nr:phosphodiester glycosidase family protein [Aquihabitans sp. G128]QXC61607.1 phosphodiester glycosidase family protein [Aquihabitans sp. G128]